MPSIHQVLTLILLLLCKLVWLHGLQLWEIDHFTVVCLVAWPLNESEAGVDLALIETSLLFICKFLLISMRTASLTWEKQGGFYENKVTSSLTFIQRPGNQARNCKMVYCYYDTILMRLLYFNDHWTLKIKNTIVC